MNAAQLEVEYHQAKPGDVPNGFREGLLLLLPGISLGRALSRLARILVWKGKRFSGEGALLVNVVSPFSVDAVHADVYVGESRFDRQKSIIIDYSKKSLIAKFIRDEIREVQPDTFLGLAYIGPVRVLFFVLDGF